MTITPGSPIRAADFPPAVEVLETTSIDNISSTSYAAGSTQCSVTFTANTMGRAKIDWWGRMQGDGTFRVFLGIEVRENNVSGTVIEAASDTEAAQTAVASTGTYPGMMLLSGLTSGGTYFVRTMHKVAGGTTSDIFTRRIIVTPQP